MHILVSCGELFVFAYQLQRGQKEGEDTKHSIVISSNVSYRV